MSGSSPPSPFCENSEPKNAGDKYDSFLNKIAEVRKKNLKELREQLTKEKEELRVKLVKEKEELRDKLVRENEELKQSYEKSIVLSEEHASFTLPIVMAEKARLEQLSVEAYARAKTCQENDVEKSQQEMIKIGDEIIELSEKMNTIENIVNILSQKK